jgi:hypothetical protein
MTKIIPGRYTAQTDQPFVVFLIGMRINKLWAIHKWLPVAMAMGPMLVELFKHPEKGMLGARTYVGWREVMVVQYWRSFEDLERFARSADDPHFPAWKRFNARIGYSREKPGPVGIWHESYMVQPGQFEVVYGNMPVFGLAAATSHVPARGQLETARRRLGGENEPAVPTPVGSLRAGVGKPHQDAMSYAPVQEQEQSERSS